jgi:4-phospho-D-threonate 3-dehydrogenase / 4-phospho-D-erythronate 3-dehydrogenase
MAAKSKTPPLIAVSMGDPAGIGPEVIVKAAAEMAPRRGAPRLLVIGDLAAMRTAAERIKTAPAIVEWRPGEPATPAGRGVGVLALSRLSRTAIRPGHPTVEGASAAYRYVVAGARMALRGEVDALVTAPISKEWLNRAGHRVPGHSELLARIAGIKLWRMMFAGEQLKLALVTVHMGLRRVSAALSERGVFDTIAMLAAHLRDYHELAHPRLGVLGFNPHAGESGLFGDEEKRAIEPAIRRARRAGIDAFGPLAPDTAFARPAGAFAFDAAVAMYHDQGLIALKTLEFNRAVNITLGLPFIRTSPDHGTAFDIAGKWIANPAGMQAAIAYAAGAAAARESARQRAA